MIRHVLKTKTVAGQAYYFRKVNKSYSITFSLEMAKGFSSIEEAFEYKTQNELKDFEIAVINIKGAEHVEQVEEQV